MGAYDVYAQLEQATLASEEVHQLTEQRSMREACQEAVDALVEFSSHDYQIRYGHGAQEGMAGDDGVCVCRTVDEMGNVSTVDRASTGHTYAAHVTSVLKLACYRDSR